MDILNFVLNIVDLVYFNDIASLIGAYSKC